MNAYYPIFLDLRERPCLVVGGGPIATGKVEGLIDAGARVTVVAPEVDVRISQWHAGGRCHWLARAFQPDDIGESFLVIAATADRALNAHIYTLADARHRLANAVDDTDHCNFIAPAIARAGAIQVAVSTSGHSPALAKQLRDEIANDVLTPERARLADFLGRWRAEVKDALPTYRQRMAFWEHVLASSLPALLDSDPPECANEAMRVLLAQAVTEARCP